MSEFYTVLYVVSSKRIRITRLLYFSSRHQQPQIEDLKKIFRFLMPLTVNQRIACFQNSFAVIQVLVQ